MPKLKGYLHPSGMLTLKKDWQYSDLYPSKIKVTGFSKSLVNFMIREGIAPSPPPQVQQKTKRKYRTGKHLKRKLLNASYMLQDTCKYKPCLMTLTYRNMPNNENNHISDYLSYLRDKTKSIKAGEYWWVKELQKRGVPHFHCLIDMPYVDVQRLNNLWQGITKQITPYGVHIRILGKNQIKNLNTITKYVTKYCTKSENVFDTRAYAISNAINKQQIPVFDNVLIQNIIENISKNAKQTENPIYNGEFWDFAYIKSKDAVKIYNKAFGLLKEYM